MTESKQQIKDRLLRHAAVFWGLNETPAETDFDPLVSLLFGACATELEKISNDIEDSRSQVLERLVQLLFPEVLTTAIPSHGIAHAEPLEGNMILSDKTAFYTRQLSTRRSENYQNTLQEIYFTPALDTKLCRSRIEYIATPQAIYKPEAGGAKKFWQPVQASYSLQQPNDVWLAVSNANNLSAGCSFYFELRNEAYKQFFYQQLPNAKWSCQGNIIDIATGYRNDEELQQPLNPMDIVEGNYNTTRRLLKDVRQYHRQQFVTIKNINVSGILVLPPFLEQQANVSADKKLPENLMWIRISFPGTVSKAALDDLHIHLNCFPVINRKQYKLQQKLMQYVNIIPLFSESHFLDMESVTGEDGKEIPQGLQQNQQSIHVNLRHAGVGRFSAKEAVSALENMIQQVKDESAAYSVIGNDLLLAELTYLQQTINKLEEQLVTKQLAKGNNPHLVFSGKKDAAAFTVYINYWGTQGQDGNNIKSGSSFFLLQNTDINVSTFQLITATAAGRDPLTENQKILAYKAALLSKEKLVTKEDLISFCRMRTGIEDGRFLIEKGYDLSALSNKSFTKTIDVKIDLPPSSKQRLMERGGIAATEKDLATAITQRSNFFMPVRVFIN